MEPAEDVPRAHDYRDLDAGLLALDDLLGDRLDARELEAELLVAHQRLAGELEQDAVERGLALDRSDGALLLADGHSARA